MTCCFPIGLVLVWTSGYKLVTKWVLTGVVTSLVVLSMIAGALTPPKAVEVDTAAPQSTATSEAPTTTEKPTITAEASTTSEEAPTTEAPTTTTAAPTTTAPTFSDAETARLALTIVMCDEYGGPDPGFGLDWCSIDSEDPDLIALIETGCDTLDSIDPDRTMPLDDVSSMLGLVGLSLIADGDATYEQVEVVSALSGAVYGARDVLCP